MYAAVQIFDISHIILLSQNILRNIQFQNKFFGIFFKEKSTLLQYFSQHVQTSALFVLSSVSVGCFYLLLYPGTELTHVSIQLVPALHYKQIK
jgi:hypothetical protein